MVAVLGLTRTAPDVVPPPGIPARLTERAAALAPGHAALTAGDTTMDYAALHDTVLRAVAALRRLGIGPGDRVGYLGVNSVDYVVLLQAALRVGAVTVAVNWRLVAREIAFIVGDAGLALLVTEAERLPMLDPDGVPTVLLVDAPHGGRATFLDWIAGHGPDPQLHPAADDDVALQLYTSGTTGQPKGALLTHANVAASLRQGRLLGEAWSRWGDDDVALVAMPQFHIGGTAWTMQALNAGGTAVLLARADIGEIIDAIERYGVTKMFAVPAVLGMILAHPRAAAADLSSVRALLYGASPIPPETLRRSMALFPSAGFVQMYGATETSGTVTYLPPEDHAVTGTPRMAGCGKPYPSVELRIVDGAGRDVPTGALGEVLIRAPLVMQGYHNAPDATAAAFLDGWYRSGDAGHLDGDGYLYLLDRVKDMIVSGAENVYPAEVEAALSDHPAVAECAVIGVPDARWGEAVKAVVVLRAGAVATPDDLIAFARQRIAGFKTPRSVDFVTDLPRNASGKILKRTLRDRYWPHDARRVG